MLCAVDFSPLRGDTEGYCDYLVPLCISPEYFGEKPRVPQFILHPRCMLNSKHLPLRNLCALCVKKYLTHLLYSAVFLFVFFSFFSASAQKIFISEILAGNATIKVDERGEYDDWVEIYNADKSEVDLGGMFLTDNLTHKEKWRFPDTIPYLTSIPSNGFLLIWCDEDERQGSLHANFKLNSGGEALYLVAKDGETIIDSLCFPQQYLDFSYGRLEQSKELSYFLTPSPYHPNGKTKITEVSPAPSFVQKSGFYPIGFSVEITIPEGCNVFYSLTGKEPTSEEGTLYIAPFSITKNTVVRMRAFKEGALPGEVVSATYFINEKISLPAVSVIVNPEFMWKGEEGIYTNPFADMEKPAQVEYFTKEGNAVVNAQVALKIFGNTSRNSSKQSFAVLAKDKFGDDRIEYPFFEDKPQIKSFDGVLLRGDVTSGRGGGDRETAGERVKNELMYQINKEAGGHLDVQAYQQVVLFINGKYWGLYNLMERKGKDFIQNNYPAVKKMDMLNSDELHVVEGDEEHYLNMLHYMESHDLTVDSAFQKLYSMLDAESLMDYWIFETYSATHDYEVNIRYWRPKTPDGKWRWVAYDEDSWGKYDEETIHDLLMEDYPEKIFILGAMLNNEKFKVRFINRYADLLNTVLSTQNISRLIDEIQLVIRDEKTRDYERWKNLVNFVEPGSQIIFLKEFAEKRPEFLRQEILKRFELSATSTVTLNVTGKGKIIINTSQPVAFPWTGIYFQDVPITLTAVPDEGHRFKGWSEEEFGKKETITVPLNSTELKLTAIFE